MKQKLIILVVIVMLTIGCMLGYFLRLFAQAIGNSDRMYYLIVAACKVYRKEGVITEELINKYVATDRPNLILTNGYVRDIYGGVIRIYVSETTNIFGLKLVSFGKDHTINTDDDAVVETSLTK